MGNVTNKLKRMDLNLLTSLDVLLDENSVTKAASRLNLSQSSVSTQLSKLRILFNDHLLISATNGRGMVPTAKAKEIHGPLKRLLHELENIVSQVQTFDSLTDSRTFNIAIADYPLTIISKILAQSLYKALGTQIQIAFHTDIKQANELMQKGELDLVIASERGIPQDAKATVLFEEKFMMGQRKSHPRGTLPLTVDNYCELKHILVSTSGGSFHGYIDEQLKELEKSRHVALSVTQFNIAKELVKHSNFVCTLPSRLLEYFSDELDRFELPFQAKGFTLYLGWHPAYDNDPAVKWLKSKLLDAFNPS